MKDGKKKDVRAYLRSFGMDDSQADELFQMIIENPANLFILLYRLSGVS